MALRETLRSKEITINEQKDLIKSLNNPATYVSPVKSLFPAEKFSFHDHFGALDLGQLKEFYPSQTDVPSKPPPGLWAEPADV